MDSTKLRRLLIGEFTWWRLLRSVAFVYTFFALYVFFRADSMIFLPSSPSYGAGEEIIKIPVTPDESIAALYLPYDQADQTLMFIHGNAGDLGDIRFFLQTLNSWGFNVFAYDYRGFGLSDGYPSESNAYEDALAAYNYLITELNKQPDQVIVYGRSVGGGSALELARQVPMAGVIVEGTFTSIFRVVVPIPLLPFDKFRNLDKIQHLEVPVLVIHGEEDQTIPFHHGQRLYEAAPEPKASLWVPAADHDDLAMVAGDQLRQAVVDFADLVAAEGATP